MVLPILIVSLFHNIKTRPYQSHKLNSLEMLSLFAAALTIYAGIFYLEPTQSQAEQLLLFVCILAANVGFCSLWLWQIGENLRTQLKENSPRLYIALCLCGKTKIMAKEMNEVRMAKKQEQFVTLIEDTIDALSSAKEIYKRGSLPVDDAEFRQATIEFYQRLQKMMLKESVSQSELNRKTQQWPKKSRI